jgi:hypothetical protein
VRQNATVRIALLAVAGLAVAAGVAFGVSRWVGGGTKQASPCAPVALSSAGSRALAAYTGRIRHDSEWYANGAARSESWYDPVRGSSRTVEFDRHGHVSGQFGATRRTMTFVDYAARNWTVQRLPHANGVATAAALSAEYRRGVGRGVWKVVGRETVDGRSTLHLQQLQQLPLPRPAALPKSVLRSVPKRFRKRLAKAMAKATTENLPPEPQRAVHLDTWVDALTYVPVRLDSNLAGQRSETDEVWLPRTAANVALTRLVIPPGFRKLTPQTGSEFSELVNAPPPACRHS